MDLLIQSSLFNDLKEELFEAIELTKSNEIPPKKDNSKNSEKPKNSQ